MADREIDSEMFVEKFCSVPKKLDKKIDLKKIINEQLGRRRIQKT